MGTQRAGGGRTLGSKESSVFYELGQGCANGIEDVSLQPGRPPLPIWELVMAKPQEQMGSPRESKVFNVLVNF